MSSSEFANWFDWYSVSIRAVDPSIKLGVSGDDPEWLDEVLTLVGDQVDWVSVSVEPLKGGLDKTCRIW